MPRTLTSFACAILLATGVMTATPVSPAQAATARPASSAGSTAVGSTTYSVPSGAVFVSPSGNDAAAGSQSAPLRTINRAITVAPAGGTVVLRAGSYNESLQIFKKVTIQNFPGEAAWLDGAVPVTGWVKDGSVWRKDGWTTRFDHSPTYTKGAADMAGDWRMLDSTAPMAAHPDQLWVGGSALSQVASRGQVSGGKFYVDEAGARLYAGSDPTSGAAASNQQYAINIRADGVTVRGIGVRRYAPSVWQMGAVTVERPNATLENVNITDSATTGLSVLSSGATLTKVTSQNNGMLGIHGNHADNIRMTGVLVRNNNTEKFHVGPVAGGLKFTKSRGVTVTNSSFADNNGHGFWEDQSVYNSIFSGNDFLRNTGYGLFLEISAKAIVADSLIMNNKREGLLINNFANVQIWNNTIVGNSRPIWLAQDTRRNTNRSDPAVDTRISWPDSEMPWQLDYVTLGNNVLGNPASGNALLCAEDYTYTESAEQMHIVSNGNVYNRASSSSPSWLSIWTKGKGGAYTFTSLAAMKSTTGQEARSKEYTGASVVNSSGVLSSAVTNEASSVALPLPSAVASAIGRPAGTQTLGAWTGASGSAPAPNPPAPNPPAPNPPAQTVATATDNFGRNVSGGWGTADKGGAWAIPAGGGQFSVANGTGQIRLKAGDGFKATLGSVSSTSTDSTVRVSLDRAPNGDGQFVSLIGRDRGSSNYEAKVRVTGTGQVTLWLVRAVNGSSSVIEHTTAALTLSTGGTLALRLQVTGTSPTTVRAKVWKDGSTEPGGWTVSGSDNSSALQQAGSVGLWAYASSNMTNGPISVRFDQLNVVKP